MDDRNEHARQNSVTTTQAIGAADATQHHGLIVLVALESSDPALGCRGFMFTTNTRVSMPCVKLEIAFGCQAPAEPSVAFLPGRVGPITNPILQ